MKEEITMVDFRIMCLGMLLDEEGQTALFKKAEQLKAEVDRAVVYQLQFMKLANNLFEEEI